MGCVKSMPSLWLAEFGGGRNRALRQEAPENQAVDQGEE